MKQTTQAFAIHIPDANGENTERIVTIDVPVRWDEMIDEWVLTEEAHELIESRKALEMGLLSPEQLRELRERHGLNQKQIGQLFQVGEKSWNRWESGKHRPTRSINLLMRALYDGAISIDYLRAKAGMKFDPEAITSEALCKFLISRFRDSSILASSLAEHKHIYHELISHSLRERKPTNADWVFFGAESLQLKTCYPGESASPWTSCLTSANPLINQTRWRSRDFAALDSGETMPCYRAIENGELLIV